MKEEEDSMWGNWLCMCGCKEMDVWAQGTVKCLWSIDFQSIINHKLYGHLRTCWLLEQFDYRLQFGDSTSGFSTLQVSQVSKLGIGYVLFFLIIKMIK